MSITQSCHTYDTRQHRSFPVPRTGAVGGSAGKAFTVTGRARERAGNETTFNDHTDSSFWARGGPSRIMPIA